MALFSDMPRFGHAAGELSDIANMLALTDEPVVFKKEGGAAVSDRASVALAVRGRDPSDECTAARQSLFRYEKRL